MPYDYKKEFKELYRPTKKPALIDIPEMKFIAVSGKGDPNEEDGEYKKALEKLYAIAYTIKMSKMGDHKIEGYFDFVVPPLEGLWWQNNTKGIDYSRKADFEWISLIRVPDFVTQETFDWAKDSAASKKGLDLSDVKFLEIEEGPVVQCMHVGSYDNEPETIDKLLAFIEENGYEYDHSEGRHHHEIYLSDPRRCKEENLKTIIRIPVKKRENI